MPTGDETPEEKRARLAERLTVQQRRFCEEFLKSCDAVEAYRTAYDKKQVRPSDADKLLGRWYIQDYLAALADSVGVDDRIITKGETLAHLATILRDDKAKDQDRIGAAKVVAQIRGFTVKKVEHSGRDGGPIKTQSGLDEAQLLRMRREFLGIDHPKGNGSQ